MNSGDKSPFKKACDACTRAKSKCNGKNPCQLCDKRGTPCVYAFKRKRGPSKRGDDPVSSKRAKNGGGNGGLVITPYERRLWTVFFTIFKNQENSYTDSADRGLAWCWFARQLGLLKKHCTKHDNIELCDMIQAFLDSMNLKMNSVLSSLEKSCPFTPSLCVECSSTVMAHPNTTPTFHGHVSGTCIAVDTNTKSLEGTPRGKFMTDLFAKHESGEMASFIFTQVDTPAYADVQVNQSFIDTFGLDSTELKGLLKWSGNGFLPWGGDFVAKLIVSETDLVTYLQIMCLKFQSIGMSSKEPSYIREVPSSHSFKFWVKTGEKEWSQKQCMMHCVHRVLKTNSHLSSEIICSFTIIGEPHHRDKDEKQPIVSSFETTNPDNTPNEKDNTITRSSSSGTSIEEKPAPPVERIESLGNLMIDTLPENVSEYYNGWEEIDIFDKATEQQHNTGDGGEELQKDAEWLEQLLGWHDSGNTSQFDL